MFAAITFAASMPDFIAVCDPFIFEKFIVPALHPTKYPPGNSMLGRLCRPPLIRALAP